MNHDEPLIHNVMMLSAFVYLDISMMTKEWDMVQKQTTLL